MSHNKVTNRVEWKFDKLQVGSKMYNSLKLRATNIFIIMKEEFKKKQNKKNPKANFKITEI